MTDSIIETKAPKEAILFAVGKINDVVTQFAKMLHYCKDKNLSIVNVFFDTSCIEKFEYRCFDELLEYLNHTKHKTAVVFYSRNEYCKFPRTHELGHYREKDKIELHFVKDNVTLSH
jgi:hypothetical protein